MKDEQPDFEHGLDRLEEIVGRLEAGDLSLEQSVDLFKEGLGLTKRCREQLAKAQNDVKIYRDGLLEDFDRTGEEGADNDVAGEG